MKRIKMDNTMDYEEIEDQSHSTEENEDQDHYATINEIQSSSTMANEVQSQSSSTMANEVQSQSNRQDQNVNNTKAKNYVLEDKVQKFLYYAAITGDHESLAKFIKSGEYDEANTGRVKNIQYLLCSLLETPLHVAAKHGHAKCIQMFIDYGINVNSRDHKHRTALHLAAVSNHVECVEELIRCGADCSATDNSGYSSLHRAVINGFSECVLAHLKDIQDSTYLSMAIPETGDSALHVAMRKGMIDCVKALVRSGSSINLLNGECMTPVHVACCSQSLDFDTKRKILKFIIFECSEVPCNLQFSLYDARLKALLIAYGANSAFEHWLLSEEHIRNELVSCIYPNCVEYIVNFLPRMPSLKAFTFSSGSSYLLLNKDRQASLPTADEIWHDSVLPNDVNFSIVLRRDTLYVKMFKILFGRARHTSDISFAGNDTYRYQLSARSVFERYIPLQQPFLDLVYERLTEILEELDYCTATDSPTESGRLIFEKPRLMKLRQLIWYHRLASNPRSLQHLCRCVIRKQMGLPNLKYTRKLPLPEKLQSFLLFECGEASI